MADTRTSVPELRGINDGKVVVSDLLYFFRWAYSLVQEEEGREAAVVTVTGVDGTTHEYPNIRFSVYHYPFARAVIFDLALTNPRAGAGVSMDGINFSGTIGNIDPGDVERLGIRAMRMIDPLGSGDEQVAEEIMAIRDIDGDFTLGPVRSSAGAWTIESISLREPTMIKSSLFGRAEYTEWEWKSALRAKNNDPDAAAKLLSSSLS